MFIKLILLSFIFTIPTVRPLEFHKKASEKISKIESSTEVAVLKTSSDSKLLKRIPFLETLIDVDNNQYLLKTYLVTDTFFDLSITFTSFVRKSSLARAPPSLV